MSDSIADEPHFARVDEQSDLCDEPLYAERFAQEREGALREQWLSYPTGKRCLMAMGLLCGSGLFAIISALLQEVAFSEIVGAVLYAPVIEEIGKIILLWIILEKMPYALSSRGMILAICAISGLVFAVVENTLYLVVYIPDASAGIVLWRWSVCVALHVGCALVSGSGLAKLWYQAYQSQGRITASLAQPALIVAMVIHGLYNASAILFSVCIVDS